MDIQELSIESLTPFDKNPKIHSQKQIEKLIRSMTEFGFTNPILAIKHEGKNLVIAGHARLEAAKKRRLKTVPVIFLDLQYEKAIAYNVADNKLAEMAEWDYIMLAGLVEDVKISGLDIEITGFSMDEIVTLTQKEILPYSEYHHLIFRTTNEQAEIITTELHRLRENDKEGFIEKWREINLVKMALNSKKLG